MSVRLLADVTPKYSLTLLSQQNAIEKKVIETIETLRINMEEISEWVHAMRLKDLKPYEIL